MLCLFHNGPTISLFLLLMRIKNTHALSQTLSDKKRNLIGDVHKKFKNRGLDELGLNLCLQKRFSACKGFYALFDGSR